MLQVFVYILANAYEGEENNLLGEHFIEQKMPLKKLRNI